jgi:hypothetical protein
MNPIVKKDILNVLRQTTKILKKGHVYKLRELSDHVIHNAAIFQDKHSISIAVTIYSLSKIYKYSKEVDTFILPHVIDAIKYLEEGKQNKYESEIKNIIKDIGKKNNNTKFYIQEVLERAQIKKASKMHEHGISMGQVAESLGISLWEIMDYVGKTRIVDKFEYKTDMKSKLEFTRGLFK